MTERLHIHFSLSCIGGGNGNPLQCSCLENPRDGGAWWAAIYGVAQNRTRLKRLSSSSSMLFCLSSDILIFQVGFLNSFFIYLYGLFDVLLSWFGTSLCSMFSSNCCFLTCIWISQEADQVMWYSHLLKNFPVCCDPHSQRLWHSQ